MSLKDPISLLNGEVVINKSGMYTFAHYYHHPIDKRQVIMVGMNHVGDEGYFARVKKILASCDLVLFEDIRKEINDGHDYGAEELNMRKIVFGGIIQEAFMVSLQLYFMLADKAFSQAEKEEETFDDEYQRPSWFSGDMMTLTETQWQKYEENLMRALGVIPLERKRAVVEYAREAISRMDRGELNKRTTAEGFMFLYSDPTITELLSQVFAMPRDLHCLNEFDRLVKERNPQKIGIKFGAGHTANQRLLLEKRGYVLQRSQRLCNIFFKKEARR